MFSKALLSLLSPLHSLAGAHENKAVVAHHKHTAPAWIIAGANRPQQQGKECVLTKRKWMGHRPRRRLISPKLEDEKDGHDTKPDVGILGLGRRQKKCMPDKEVCEADASSSLGGRCVPTASSSLTTTSRQLSEETELCYFKCPDPRVCKCNHSPRDSGYSEEECTKSMASACRNGDIEKCLPNYIPLFKGRLCPGYECMDDGKAYSECLTVSYEAKDKFCRDHYLDEWKDVENNTTYSYCENVAKFASLLNNSDYVESITNPNLIWKEQQLIMERFVECLANSSSSEEVYAHDYRCQCQMNSAQCELSMRLNAGGRESYAQQYYCQVANCCNTTPLDNSTACKALIPDKVNQRYYDCVSASEEGYHCECQLNSELCEFTNQASNTGGTDENSLQEYRCQVAKCCNTTSLDNLTACFGMGFYDGAYTSAPESAEPTSQPSDEPPMKSAEPTSQPSDEPPMKSAEPTSQPSDEPPMKESYPPPPENNGSGQDKSSSACRSIKSSTALTLLLANAIGFLSFILK